MSDKLAEIQFSGPSPLIVWLVSLLLSGCVSPAPSSQLISADGAVARAIESARYSTPGYRGMKGEPSEIRGKLMTFNQAEQFVNGRPLDPNSHEWIERDKLVWLIVLRADAVGYAERAPSLRGATAVPDQAVSYNLVIQFVDAETADVFCTLLSTSGEKLGVRSLPILPQPAGTVIGPTRRPITPVTPVSTKPAAPWLSPPFPLPTIGSYP